MPGSSVQRVSSSYILLLLEKDTGKQTIRLMSFRETRSHALTCLIHHLLIVFITFPSRVISILVSRRYCLSSRHL